MDNAVRAERINQIIEAIQDEHNFFSMNDFSAANDMPKKDLTKTFGKGKADFLKSNFKPDCGTPACLCGWANHFSFNVKISNEIPIAKGIPYHVTSNAKNWLELEGYVYNNMYRSSAHVLFMTSEYSFDGTSKTNTEISKLRRGITREEAIYALELLRDENKVLYWKEIRELVKARNKEKANAI